LNKIVEANIDGENMSRVSTKIIQVAVGDLNGILRGKILPIKSLKKLENRSIRLPLSALNVDLFGEDIEDSPLVFESGDKDGYIISTGRDPFRLKWLSNAPLFYPCWMFTENGETFLGDARHTLAKTLEGYSEKGWSATAATEMEFYLVNARNSSLEPPTNPKTKNPLVCADVLSTQDLNDFELILGEMQEACIEAGIDFESITSESGCGQFEVTLKHRNALLAADDALFFKIITKGVACKHGVTATFMAKPYRDQPGNGMHVHFSILGQNGENIFSNGGESGSKFLKYAVGGCLSTMEASTLIFAPYENSYERLTPKAHAPTGISWAYENRTAAIRIPLGSPASKRVEIRVAGGDANPYLLFTSILGSALKGIESKINAPQPIQGDAYLLNLPQLAKNMSSAIELFENDDCIKNIFPESLVANLVLTKKQELQQFDKIASEDKWKYYINSV
jgi:glutamine synthetase